MSKESEKFSEKFTYNIIPTKAECPEYTGEECMRTSLSREDIQDIFDAGVESAKRAEAEVKAEAIDWIQNVTKKHIANINFELSDKVKELETKCHALEYIVKKFEWHDLKKNPNDVPDNDRTVLVKCTRYGDEDSYIGGSYRGGWNIDGVNATMWREI